MSVRARPERRAMATLALAVTIVLTASAALAVDADEAIEKARALETSGNADEAFVYLSELVDQDERLAGDASVLIELSRLTPSTEESVELLERAVDRARDGEQASRAQQLLGDYLYARGSYLEAAERFASAADRGSGAGRDEALLKRAASLLAAGDADAAADAYGELAGRRDTSEDTRPWALLGLGRALQFKGDLHGAAFTYDSLASEYPEHEARPRALAGAGEALAAAGEFPDARIALKTLVREYPASYEAVLARDDLLGLPPDTTGISAPAPDVAEETDTGADEGR